MGIIGSALSAVGSIAGGIMGARSAAKQKKMIKEAQQKNTDWYNQRYNEDATQRADAQALLTQTKDILSRQGRQAAGSAAVSGGSEESVAAAKAAANKTVSDTMAQINQQADSRKDQIENTYLAQDRSYDNQLLQNEQNKQQQIQGATKGVSEAMNNMPF